MKILLMIIAASRLSRSQRSAAAYMNKFYTCSVVNRNQSFRASSEDLKLFAVAVRVVIVSNFDKGLPYLFRR